MLPSTRPPASALWTNSFRGAIPRLRVPLPTSRLSPRGDLRTPRGRCGSLHLHRRGLAPPAPCQSLGKSGRSVTQVAFYPSLSSSSRSAFASWRSAVSKPWVHQPSIGTYATKLRDTAPTPSRLLFTLPARSPWHPPHRGAPSRVGQRGGARQRLEKLSGGGRAREGVHEVHEPRGRAGPQQASHDVAELVLDFGQGQRAPGAHPLQSLSPMGVDLHHRCVRRQRIVCDQLHTPHEAADPRIVEPPVVI